MQHKKTRSIPKNSVTINSLTDNNAKTKNIAQSVHKTKGVTLDTSNDLYFFKENKAKPDSTKVNHKNSEYEAAAGAIYTLLIGDRAALTIGVVNDQGERIGVASKGIEDFTTIKRASEEQAQSILKKANLSKDKFIKSHIALVLVAAYIFEENDLHLENIGFDKNGNAVKIDHDQSFYTLTRKYTPLGKDTKYQINIHADDIETFPVLKIANPRRWVIDGFKTSALNSISKDPVFNKEKYTYFLKAIILPRSLLKAISKDNFSTEQGIKRFDTYLMQRLDTLTAELIKVPAFTQFMQDNPTIGNEIIEQLPLTTQKEAKKTLARITDALALPSKQQKSHSH